MPKRDATRTDAAFERGALGADGEVVEATVEPEERERDAALESLQRNRAYLGREFLTWILWASNDGAPLCSVDGATVTVLVVGRVILRGLAGEATELAVKGHMSAYSPVVRYAIDQGLLVHVARLRMQWGEHLYEATVDAEFLDVRSATIPKVVDGATEDGEEHAEDRLATVEHVGQLIDALWAAFIEVRLSAQWTRRTVPQLKAWLQDI